MRPHVSFPDKLVAFLNQSLDFTWQTGITTSLSSVKYKKFLLTLEKFLRLFIHT